MPLRSKPPQNTNFQDQKTCENLYENQASQNLQKEIFNENSEITEKCTNTEFQECSFHKENAEKTGQAENVDAPILCVCEHENRESEMESTTSGSTGTRVNKSMENPIGNPESETEDVQFLRKAENWTQNCENAHNLPSNGLI